MENNQTKHKSRITDDIKEDDFDIEAESEAYFDDSDFVEAYKKQGRQQKKETIGLSDVFTSKSKDIYREIRALDTPNDSRYYIEETPFIIPNYPEETIEENHQVEELNDLTSEVEAEFRKFKSENNMLINIEKKQNK